MESYLNLPTVITSLIVLSLASICLNSLSIYIIATVSTLWKKTSTLLLLNLLAVHLFQGVFVFPLYIGKKVNGLEFKAQQFFANGFRFTYMVTFYGTCLGILLIAVDRFLATCLLTKYRSIVTRKRVSIALILMWMYILLLCLIPFTPPQYTNDSVTNTSKPEKYVYKQQKEWVLFMLIVNNAVPYWLTILCYVYIVVRLRRLGAYNINPHKTIVVTGKNGESMTLKKKDIEKHKQVTKLTLTLSFLYGLFWTPSIVYYPLLSYCTECFPENYKESRLEQHVGFITKYMAFLDAFAAPLVYCFMHKEFQYSLERIRSKLLKKPPPPKPAQTIGETTELL